MKRLAKIAQRLNQLTELLGGLKERVRDAITGELSRIVANTVQDAVQNLLRQPADRYEPPPPQWSEEDPWNDPPNDDWNEPHSEPPLEAPGPAERWQRALELGNTVLRWWLASRWKPWLGLGVAGLAGAATWWGGPTLHAGTNVILSAAELIAFGTTHSLR